MAELQPERQPGTFAFVCVDPATDLTGLEPVATMREPEGLTLVLPVEQARARGLAFEIEMAWITLMQPTALDAVGITAAFARQLAQAAIPCNVIAGVHHDHLFVPANRAEQAAELLSGLSFQG
ncbi:MAG: ACT domain-containing protein [bacterium]|nr:ACT domain-containing protein [bacterium]